MGEEIREKILKVYCDKAKRDVTVVIGIAKCGKTKYVKVLCPYFYRTWGVGAACEKGGVCGIEKGAWNQ